MKFSTVVGEWAMAATTGAGAGRAFCGVDVGTQGVRVVILSEAGRQLAVGSASITSDDRRGAVHEQSPEQWWTALVTALRAAVAGVDDGVEIAALALDATSGTVLVESADGSPRGPALMYDDTRAADQARRAARDGASLWACLGYRMQPSWALPKAMWLVENGALAPGDRIVHQSDHLLRRLIGERVATDTSHALKTGADLRDGTWPRDLLRGLGLDFTLLPDLVVPGTTLGRVSGAGARATGLRAGTPVRAGMTDGCASQIAARALRPGSWSSALGTTLVVKGSTASPVIDPSGAVYSHRHPDGGWLPGGASSTGAGVLEREFPDADRHSLDALTAQARGLVPVPGVTYPLMGRGERFPFVAPDACGFTAPGADTPPARFAALCQGIAYVERLAYDVLRVLGADVSGPVSFTGGAARNAWWNQLRTDVLGRPTLLPGSTQAATGMAVLAAAPPGELAATAERMIRVVARYEPDERRADFLRPGYERLVHDLAGRGWLQASLAQRVLAGEAAQR
jgi:sugar (pentulose or hexulose) kinase